MPVGAEIPTWRYAGGTCLGSWYDANYVGEQDAKGDVDRG